MDIIESFYKEYFEYLPGEFDNAYILHANSGEVYCFLAYLAKACLKNDGTKNPLFVATKPYHEDIIEMFYPKARYVYYDLYLKEPRLDILGDYWEYSGHKFRQIFSIRHFDSVNINLGQIHYFDAMLKTLGLERGDVSKPTPKVAKKTKDDVIKIANNLNLNLDKFVIIAPEALTTGVLPEFFWRDLIRELYKNGYDIFLNATKACNLNGKKYKLSFKETYALASMSKAVISLKSGLSEFLHTSNSNNIIIANKFHWDNVKTSDECLRAYTIMKLPYVNKNEVFELNAEQYKTANDLIYHILELVKNKKVD